MDLDKSYLSESDSSSSECNDFSGFEDDFSGFEDEFSGFEEDFSGFEDDFAGSDHDNSVDLALPVTQANLDQAMELSGQLDIEPYASCNTAVLSATTQAVSAVMEDVMPINIFDEGEEILLLISRKEELGRELTPIMAMLMTLPCGNDNHPDVVSLIKMLANRKVTIEEFKHIVGPLQKKICRIMNECFEDYVYDHGNGNIIYVLRAAAEALALRCVTFLGGPYLTEQWQNIAMSIFVTINEDQFMNYGYCSNKLSTWVIRTLGDPQMTLNQGLRHNMVLLYRWFVKILNHNRKEALESFLYTFRSLGRYDDSILITVTTEHITDILIEQFTNANYPKQLRTQFLYKFGQNIAESVKIFRSNCLAGGVTMEWMMGVKPKELYYLTGLVRYISDEAHIEFNKLEKDISFIDLIMCNDASIYKVESTSSALLLIVRFFKEALQDSLVKEEIISSFMDILEAAVHIGWDFRHELTFGAVSRCLKNVDEFLTEACYETSNGRRVIKFHIQQEFNMKYKKRLKIMRELVSNDFLMETPMIYNTLYN